MNEKYISIVIVGKSETHLAWHWQTWSKIVPWLDPILMATKEKVGVRSSQMVGEKYKDVPFGQMGWDAKSHQKWPHFSEVNNDESPYWKFCLTEIWAPRWTVCLRERRDPLAFISITDPLLVVNPKPGQFNQFIQISTPLGFFQEQWGIIDQAVQNIAELLESVLTIFRVSLWNVRGDSVQSALNNHLGYLGKHNDLIPDLSKTTGNWLNYNSIGRVE